MIAPTSSMAGRGCVRIPGANLQLTPYQQEQLFQELSKRSVPGKAQLSADEVRKLAVQLFGSR